MKVTIKKDKVVSVYSGKARTCCCGCAGVHTYASAHIDKVKRGYPVELEEICDFRVQKIVRKIERFINLGTQPDTCESYIAVEVGKRQYIAYFS